MEGICGGWLLHKAMGGSGRRKLTVIPPETEGYSVSALKAVSGGGKGTFYIVPLQETLDTCPLPPDSEHFSKMPKKTCYQCREEMPLHMLAVHIKTCTGKEESDETLSEDSDVFIVDKRAKVVCPICNLEFPDDEIKIHASLCGERFDTPDLVAQDCGACSTKTPECTPKSMEDVLLFLEQQVDSTNEFKLCVARDDLPDRGILQWQRKKATSPTSALKVVFIGEAGIDTGALRKEFLTAMISGIEKRFFEGAAGSHGKNPRFSLTDLDNDIFRTVGEIMAVSLAQGGPAPAFFREWCYKFLCSGEVNFSSLSKDDVADLESALLISRVENAADSESLMLLLDDITSCGFTAPIKMDNKESIIRAIVLHSTTRLIPMLQQLRKGLELYGLVNQLTSNAEACRPLFVPGMITKPDADFIMMNCQPQYSEKGTSRERQERRIINCLQDFLEEVERSETEVSAAGEVSERLAVQDVLQWMTGQAHIPILPDEKQHFKITFMFDHECGERLGYHTICYPVVSACTGTVTFPVQHLNTYSDFRKTMTEAVKYGGGFYRV